VERRLVAAAAEEGVWHSRPKAWSFNGSQGYVSDVAATILARDGPKVDVGVLQDGFPRKYLTVERERLQGFPDGWTDIPAATYDLQTEVLGNSMTVPVIRWVGERIEEYERDQTAAAA
jgi:DNA (cytosine-5)-methyltransferase 1